MCEFSSDNSVNYLNEVLFKEYDQWKWTNCKTDVQTDKPITNLMYKQINQSKTWYKNKWTNHEPDVQTNEPITNLMYIQMNQSQTWCTDNDDRSALLVTVLLPIIDMLLEAFRLKLMYSFSVEISLMSSTFDIPSVRFITNWELTFYKCTSSN